MAQEVKKSMFDLANEVSIISFVTCEREKIETEKAIKYHEEGITIDEADVVDLPDRDGVLKKVGVIHFKEEKDCFMFCGAVLTDRIQKMCAKAFQGDYIEFTRALKDDPLKVKLFHDKTKNNTTFTNVKFIR